MPSESRAEQALEYYRRAVEGHVYIRETLQAFFEVVGGQVRRCGAQARVLELGSHAGFITQGLVERWPELSIVVSDHDAAAVEIARERSASWNVSYHQGSLASLGTCFDIVLSVARHHHLPHGYLPVVRELLAPSGVYVLADELCPEYCEAAELQRLETAPVLRIAGGYVFTSDADRAAFEREGTVPSYASELERARRRALWRWYRFVVEHAVERGYFDIAAAELRSASDDLVTGSDAEHKFGPAVVEREFALAGFERLSKRSIGAPREPELQSMFVYEYGRA